MYRLKSDPPGSVRPFGLLTRPYQLDKRGRTYFQAAQGLVFLMIPLSVVLTNLHAPVYPTWLFTAGSLILIVLLLCVFAIRNGQKL